MCSENYEKSGKISTVQTPSETQNNRFDTAREFMYSVHLITAAQAAAGVHGGEKVTVEFIASLFTVWSVCEGEMWVGATEESSGAVGLPSEAVTHFMELNTEQTGWRQVLLHAAGYQQTHSSTKRAGRETVCRAQQY